jgi:hypothetical protein
MLRPIVAARVRGLLTWIKVASIRIDARSALARLAQQFQRIVRKTSAFCQKRIASPQNGICSDCRGMQLICDYAGSMPTSSSRRIAVVLRRLDSKAKEPFPARATRSAQRQLVIRPPTERRRMLGVDAPWMEHDACRVAARNRVEILGRGPTIGVPSPAHRPCGRLRAMMTANFVGAPRAIDVTALFADCTAVRTVRRASGCD